jgi:hypothetical protein
MGRREFTLKRLHLKIFPKKNKKLFGRWEEKTILSVTIKPTT